MEIIKGRFAGFCDGIKNTIKVVEKLSKENEETESFEKFFSLGELITNQSVITGYFKKGLVQVEDSNNLKKGDKIIIGPSGTTLKVLRDMNSKNLKIFNCTCPFVKKAKIAAERLSDKGFFIVLLGTKNHPEVNTILGNIDKNLYTVIEDETEAISLPVYKKTAFLAQTPQYEENFKIISKIMTEKFNDELVIKDTICKNKKIRLKEISHIACIVDLMLIIGRKNSKDAKHLYDTSKRIQPKTFHIENVYNIKKEWFYNIKKVGLYGSSTIPYNDLLKAEEYIREIIK
jgi:4-hydroxy-3-methylbut-2-en-1-yl diphosphate reductase